MHQLIFLYSRAYLALVNSVGVALRNKSVTSGSSSTDPSRFTFNSDFCGFTVDDDSPSAVRLTCKTHPNIRFWMHDDFKNASLQGTVVKPQSDPNSEGKDNKNNQQLYLEDKDGNIIGGAHLRAIRNFISSCFFTMRDRGRAAMSWMETPHDIRQAFYRELCRKFEEFTFCNDNWKAQQIAVNMYPHFKKRHLKAMGPSNSGTKQEPSESSLGKRAQRDPSSERQTKSMKSDSPTLKVPEQSVDIGDKADESTSIVTPHIQIVSRNTFC